MSLFESQEEMYDRDRQPHRKSKLGPFFLKLFIGMFTLPAMAIGGIQFWALFGYGKLRLSVVTFITFIELIFIIPIINSFHPLRTILSFLTLSGKPLFSDLVFAYFLICIILGVLGALVLIAIKVYQFKTNPSLLVMDGWAYMFTYRKTPLELLRRKLLKKDMEEGKCYNAVEAPLGILEEAILYQGEEIDDSKSSLTALKADIVSRTYAEAKKHTLVTGATGSGKTVALLSLIYNDIINGYPVCVVDFKKSSDVLYFLSKWAKDMDRDFYYFANGNNDDLGNDFYYQKATYDPFSSGEQSSRSDVILSLREWDTASDVYKGRTESLLNALFFALLTVEKEDVPRIPWNEGGLNQIISAMDITVMLDLIIALRKKEAQGLLDKTDLKRLETFNEIYTSLSTKTPEGKGLREQLDGIRLICNKLIMSSYGNWLSKGMSKLHIDLLKIATAKNGPIVLFSLSGMEEPEFAKALGSIISSDLKRTVNIKNEMGDKNNFGIYIDEFQTLDPNDVTDLLEKARSANAFCTLATQSLEKISAASPINGEATLRSILDTCGNYLFHSGAKEDSGERMAKILGKTKHIRRRVSTKANANLFTQNILAQRQGVVNKEIEEDWIIPPSKFQNLSVPTVENKYKSEAYFITNFAKGGGSNKTVFGAQKIQVIAQKELTLGVSSDFAMFMKDSTADKHLKQTGEDIRQFMGQNTTSKEELIEDDSDFDELFDKKVPVGIIEDQSIIEDWSIEEMIEDAGLIDDDGAIVEVKPTTTPKKEVNTIEKTSQQRKRPLTSFEKMKLEQNKKTSAKVKIESETESGFKLPDL